MSHFIRFFQFVRHVPIHMAAVLLFAVSLQASAIPIHYNIAFTTDNGTTTPTGSFDYDGSLAVTASFSNFLVSYGTAVFDFTAVANAFTFRTDAGSFHTSCAGLGVNNAFQMLTHAQCVVDVATIYQWQANTGSSFADFTFRANSGTGNNVATDQFGEQTSSTGVTDSAGYGNSFIATASPTTSVPEPASLTLLGLGLAGLGFARRKKQQA